MTTPPPLAYAPRPPLLRRRWTTPALVAAAVLTVAAVSPHWWPPLSRHVRLLYWQHRCLQHRPTMTIASSVHEWDAFYGILSPPGDHYDSVIFLHERSRPDGKERLVYVSEVHNTMAADNRWYLSIDVIVPGTLAHDPAERPGAGEYLEQPSAIVKRVAQGVSDQVDQTHFTFDGQCVDDQHVTYDGWLKDDDRVVIERRNRQLP